MWYIAFRNSQSLLVEDWKLQGAEPCYGFGNFQAAAKAAETLAQSMDYDTRVIFFTDIVHLQMDSRSRT